MSNLIWLGGGGGIGTPACALAAETISEIMIGKVMPGDHER